MKCIEMTLQGRCQQKAVPSPVSKNTDYCYYHGKLYDGLTTKADVIVPVDEDDDF